MSPAASPWSRLLCLIAGVTLATGACAGVPTQSASMQATPEITASASELQLRAFELGRKVSTLVERAADSITAASADPAVQRRALLWKISAIPLIQEAALRNDPQVASVDLLAFTVQQTDYFTTGSGKDAFGPAQAIAVDAAQEAERASFRLVSSALESGTLADSAETNIRQWAAAHPMQGPMLRRASVLDSDWKVLGLTDNSVRATLGNVDRTMVNLTYRLSYLNETLAAEMRWNAELAGQEALRAPKVDSMLGLTGSTLESVGSFTHEFPPFLDSERTALMEDLDRQRVALMRDIDRQRALVMQDLAAQRVALEASVAAERTAVFLSADTLVQRSLDRSDALLRRLVWQLGAVALLVVAALVGSGWLLLGRWRRVRA
jgi:hypothetical protein